MTQPTTKPQAGDPLNRERPPSPLHASDRTRALLDQPQKPLNSMPDYRHATDDTDATIAAIMDCRRWQQHSVRGFCRCYPQEIGLNLVSSQNWKRTSIRIKR